MTMFNSLTCTLLYYIIIIIFLLTNVVDSGPRIAMFFQYEYLTTYNILEYLSENLKTWTSKNEKIDYFIQRRQLNHYCTSDVIIEWIPYNQFIEIKEISKSDSYITLYSAIWKDGPLKHNCSDGYIRSSNKKITLKYLHNSEDPIDSLINKAKKYSRKWDAFLVLYGISQNPDTNDYIFVQNNYILASGNERIDNFIQEMQLEIDKDNTVIEWIPYNQFTEIEEISKSGSYITVYSAIWKDGPLKYDYSDGYIRSSNKKITLKYLHNSEDPIDSLINEAKKYSKEWDALSVLYGISQNPDTNDYILIQNDYISMIGNERIDNFIQEIQLNDKYFSMLFEWIPYNQFIEIKEISKSGSYLTVYSAIWKDGPLKYDYSNGFIRSSNKKITLKYLHNSEDPIDSLINEAKKYSRKLDAPFVLYGISQNLDTNDYILISNNYISTSGNKRIDNFIQEMQLEINEKNTVIEWIPYNQFIEIEEISKSDSYITVYSAIWKDGPLKHNCRYGYIRSSNKKITLKYLHNSEDPIDSLINEAEKYSRKRDALLVLYGISQNPDTNDYILVQNNLIINWNGNKEVDDFIQEMQLKINDIYNNTVIEWIPYNQFIEIEEISKSNSYITVHSAIWKNGPLKYNYRGKYIRSSNKKITLKYLYNSEDPIDSLINEAKKYSRNWNAPFVLYGISQNPDTNDYILVSNNYISTSRNERIDNFIQKLQLKINKDDIVIEWIPYNQFIEIKEISKSNSYSAMWKNGPLEYDYSNGYIRSSNKKITLKYLHNSEDPIDSLINEAEKYSRKWNALLILYGISQNPDTNDYILVQNNSIINWNGNKEVDNFIQEMQFKINDKYNNTVIEWIPYNQFIEIKEISKSGSYITLYSAIWKDGPFKYNYSDGYIRSSNKKITLKYLHNSEDPIDSLTNEAKKYSRNWNAPFVLYGISQNPDTNDYILVQNNYILTSGNERIDNFIQEMQLEIIKEKIVIEWIPYNQFTDIEKISKSGSYITLYSAIWKDGPLKHNCSDGYIRSSNKKITLKYLHNSEDPIDSLINEAKKYLKEWDALLVLYGISQNPDTNDYILIQNNYILTIGNERIDNFIQEMQLNDKYFSTLFGWIPYSQFIEIKEISKSNSYITVYSAIWKDGLLEYNHYCKEYIKSSNTKVTLKYLHNLEDPIDSLINEAKKYSRKWDAPFVLYGISQNPDTNDYILILNNYISTSGNERIDNFIQEMQLKINYNTVFEWIPYNQFIEIEEISKSSSYITVYSAIWKDGLLKYYYPYYYNGGYIRSSNTKVTLKYLHNLEDPIDSLINEAKKYSRNWNAPFVLYGISQNPDTNDYILVQNNYILTSGNERIDNFIQEMQLEIIEEKIVIEWIPYDHFIEIEEISKSDSYITYSAIWKHGPLKHNYSDGYIRCSNKKIILKHLHNSEDSIDFVINEDALLVLYGISQNPDTNDYILVQNDYTLTSGNERIDNFIQEIQSKINENGIVIEWIPYNQFIEIEEISKSGSYITVYSAIWKDGLLRSKNTHYILLSENGSVDNVIQEMQLKINGYNDIIFEWIPYSQFNNIKKIGEGGFSTIYLAKWKDGPLEYAKNYSIIKESKIINIYGISQNPETEDYILVLNYAKDGSFNDWMNENYMYFNWQNKLYTLLNIIYGLKEIHEKNIVHRDFHTGNILFFNSIEYLIDYLSISDMGLCGEVGNVDETKIYGVMPYVAPEVLRGKPYTKAADIYSFGMIMYFVATGKQPFNNCAHDKLLALDICGGKRPDIHEPEAPRCYINLMKKCWNSNPIIRPNITELDELISSFYNSFLDDFVLEDDIGIQFKEAEEYRKANLLSFKNNQAVSHPQAIYTSRLLNPFTEGLSECNVDYNVDYYKSHPYTEDISQYNEDYESHPYAEAISQNNKDYESHPYTEDISQYNEDYESQCLDLQI
ncbi:hypothetical protein RclHR1_07060003 [Rhizophagus clarus]|uniref:Protein kinase domain-containing protein n=1 Tax=Rhizophagus clarus TaxID=94130 RepID=A0A2Z6SAT1_9GLOM|nr:hypothetical protein RclHR1_07060003 [Rhizophagus clarus]